jgi:hypothetical protein
MRALGLDFFSDQVTFAGNWKTDRKNKMNTPTGNIWLNKKIAQMELR